MGVLEVAGHVGKRLVDHPGGEIHGTSASSCGLQGRRCRGGGGRRSAERLLGKLGYATSPRRIEHARKCNSCRIGWNEEVFQEFQLALILVPLMQASIHSPWSPRVVCTDAAPGGHGLSYACASSTWAQCAARRTEIRREYSMLTEDIAMVPQGARQMKIVELNFAGLYWHHMGRPGCWPHIVWKKHALLDGALRAGRSSDTKWARAACTQSTTLPSSARSPQAVPLRAR